MAKHRTTSIQTDADLKIIIINNKKKKTTKKRIVLIIERHFFHRIMYLTFGSVPNLFIHLLFIYLFIDKRTSFIKVSLYLLNLVKGRHYLVEIKLDMNEQILRV